MQLMDIHVCQEFSARLGRAVGNELREFVLNVALHIPGVVGVCAVTRTRGFRAKQRVTGVTYDDYVMQQKGRHDRGLLFHTGGGAVVIRPVHNWRPADHENDGKGTLIRYDLGKIQAERWRAARPQPSLVSNQRREHDAFASSSSQKQMMSHPRYAASSEPIAGTAATAITAPAAAATAARSVAEVKREASLRSDSSSVRLPSLFSSSMMTTLETRSPPRMIEDAAATTTAVVTALHPDDALVAHPLLPSIDGQSDSSDNGDEKRFDYSSSSASDYSVHACGSDEDDDEKKNSSYHRPGAHRFYRRKPVKKKLNLLPPAPPSD